MRKKQEVILIEKVKPPEWGIGYNRKRRLRRLKTAASHPEKNVRCQRTRPKAKQDILPCSSGKMTRGKQLKYGLLANLPETPRTFLAKMSQPLFAAPRSFVYSQNEW